MTVGRTIGGLPLKAIPPLLFAVLVWGSTWTAIRHQLGVEAPGWSIAWRFIIAAGSMALYARVIGTSLRIRRADLPLLAAVGAAQFTLNFLCIYHAERYVTSGLVAMIFALLIVPNALFGRIFLKHHVGGTFIIGTLLACAGMALLFRQEIASATAGEKAGLGIALTLGATLCASAGNLLQASQRAGRMHWAALLVWSMGLGALFNAVAALVMSGPPVIDTRPAYWIATVYLGLFGSALTFPIYLSVIRQIGPARAAYSGVLTPIVAMLFSTLLEGYRWTPSAIAGSVLAIAGLLFALRSKPND